MSTYVISDIHGDYKQFMKMLKIINFTREDALFLLGDILDRGNEGLKILQYTMQQPNIFGIIGNHEFMALPCLEWLHSKVTEDSVKNISGKFREGFLEWLNVGGQSTMDEFKLLDDQQQLDIINYLKEFKFYKELIVNGQNFVLVHAGIDNFDIDKPLSKYSVNDFLFNKPDYFLEYYPNKYLVTGHTPTRFIYESELNLPSGIVNKDSKKYDKIFNRNNHLAIDCGCSYGGRLGAICLDTLEVYYA